MASVDDEHVIIADDYVTPEDALISNINPDLSLFPMAGKDDAVYTKLTHAHPHLKVYRRAETPARWHLRDSTSPRVPPLTAIGIRVGRSSAVRPRRTSKPAGRRASEGSTAGIRN